MRPLPSDLAAVHAHPELALLIALREAGWHGLPPVLEHGQLTEVDGVRVWPNGWRDGIRIRGPHDVLGIRINTDDPPRIVWERTGNVVEICATLLDLPEPGRRGCPTAGYGLRTWTLDPRSAQPR